MDAQHGSPFSWAYFCQAKTMEELKHSLLCTTMELEQTKILVQEELRKRDDQVLELKELLSKAMKERDEAKEKYQKLFLEKLVHHHHQHQQVSSIEDEPRRGIDSNNGFSSSDCEESIVSSPVVDPIQRGPQATIELVPDRPLPEKGKLLQAVMKAGPLLQTLLLAGPLPQWRHPPPPLDSFDIPP
ncbi:hypothetical protein Golax_020061, partial [Gossypium laxum]|nr:hypothetical protein [Gossypium laxum]